MISKNQDNENSKGSDFIRPKTAEISKVDFPPKSSNPVDFDQLIQDIDRDIHYFDRVVAPSLSLKGSFTAINLVNKPPPAH